MNDRLNSLHRRHVRLSVIASLAAVLALSLTLFAGAGTKPPRTETAKPAAAETVATAPEAAPDNNNDNIGCGNAEPCYATN